MYNYTYDNGRIEQATESDVTFNDYYYIASKTVISKVFYFYDGEGTLTKKLITTPNGEQVITYNTAENDSQLVKTVVGEHSFLSSSKNDSFGRKEFDELQLGTGFVYRKFEYLDGVVTEEHANNKLLKSTPTTQLVSKIELSDGRTIAYEYDAEERITKVTDSVDGTTEYTYDALGQLLTETKNGQAVNTMTYDNYGNILSKNGKAYVYDQTWKDKLISYNGQAIAYDKQGNPTTYLGNALTWEKGRQLKSFGSNTYTYNANGIRNSKTVDGIRHDFYLDGGKILKEVWNGNVLETVFDNEDSVCGIIYNGTPYYFLKNLQGDIIAITDNSGNVVARYSYDAWGKCTIDSTTTNVTIANINPFRYRGYYYDSETELYYLQSRYYDAVVGRFLNGDAVEFAVSEQDPLSHNLFGYCSNNAINKKDAFGFSTVGVIGISAAAILKFLLSLLKVLYSILIFLLLLKLITEVVGYLSNVLSEISRKAKSSKKYNGYEKHHIVAERDVRAQATRNLIKKYGISVYVSQNLVTIKKTLHKHLHTNSYHVAIYLILSATSKLKGSWYQKRAKILAVLSAVKNTLSAISTSI